MRYDHFHDSESFNIEDLVQRTDNRTLEFECNCNMARILPWETVSNTKRDITEFGLIWIEVPQNSSVDAHEHDEEELFCILQGTAKLILEGQTTELESGDIVYIPRYWNHQMCNPNNSTLKFMDIYWDHKGRDKQTAEIQNEKQ